MARISEIVCLLVGMHTLLACVSAEKQITRDPTSVFDCVFEEDLPNCVQIRTIRNIKNWMVEVNNDSSNPGNHDSETSRAKNGSFIDDIGDLIAIGMKKLFNNDEEEEIEGEKDLNGQHLNDDDVEVYRGKTKDGTKKMLLKMQTMMMAISGAFQVKMILLTVLNFMVSAVNLYKTWKGGQPVFYKQVHHHHTQELHPTEHGGGHYRREEKGQIDLDTSAQLNKNIPLQKPLIINHNPWYRPMR